MVGIYIGQYALNTIVWFFLTWFPTYLVTEKGLSLIQTGFAASVPYIGAFFGGIVGGVISDRLLKKENRSLLHVKHRSSLGFFYPAQSY